MTLLNLTGYVFCCTGVAFYNYIKLMKLKAKEVQKKALLEEDIEANQKLVKA